MKLRLPVHVHISRMLSPSKQMMSITKTAINLLQQYMFVRSWKIQQEFLQRGFALIDYHHSQELLLPALLAMQATLLILMEVAILVPVIWKIRPQLQTLKRLDRALLMLT